MTKDWNESREERRKRLLDQMRQKYNVPEETIEHDDNHADSIDPVNNKDRSEGIVAYQSEMASPVSEEKTTIVASAYDDLKERITELEKVFQKAQRQERLQKDDVAQIKEENQKLQKELKEIKNAFKEITDEVESLKRNTMPNTDKSRKALKVKLSQKGEQGGEADDQRIDQLYKELETLKEHLFELNKLKEYTTSLKSANKMLEDKSRVRESQKHKKSRWWHRIFK